MSGDIVIPKQQRNLDELPQHLQKTDATYNNIVSYDEICAILPNILITISRIALIKNCNLQCFNAIFTTTKNMVLRNL